MGNVMDKWFGIDPPKTQKITPLSPLPTMDDDSKIRAMTRARQRSGQAKTILAGDLIPMNLDKRTLLG
jgi:hypothetical protein